MQLDIGLRLRLLPEPARFAAPQWLYLRAVLGGKGLPPIGSR